MYALPTHIHVLVIEPASAAALGCCFAVQSPPTYACIFLEPTAAPPPFCSRPRPPFKGSPQKPRRHSGGS